MYMEKGDKINLLRIYLCIHNPNVVLLLGCIRNSIYNRCVSTID